MNNNLMSHHSPLLLPSLAVILRASLSIGVECRKVLRAHAVAIAWGIELLLAGVEEIGDPQAERATLVPAAVGEGWVVGGRGREVPLLVGGVEAGAMSMVMYR